MNSAPRLDTAGRMPATAAVACLLTLIALLVRFQQFGNPIIHVDEQFYLLVGDRMLHGAVPYIDIWDRKPVGLFLIYAGIRLLGGSGIIQYQLVATAFAIATALVVYRAALRLARPRAAVLAGLAYLLWIPLLTGVGGQSPVFYNLFVASAAALILRASERPTDRKRLATCGLLAMLLIGLAIEVKGSALFEGLYFGFALLWLGRRAFRPLGFSALIAAWVATALLPTVAIGLAYWWRGEFAAFWYANFVSIFERGPLDRGDSVRNAAALALYLAPLLIIATQGAKMRWTSRGDDAKDFASCFLATWFLVSVLSVALFGYYFDHYGLPIVAPAAICAGPFLDEPRWRRWSATILSGALIACLLLPTFNQRRRGTPAQFAALVQVVRPHAARGLLVLDSLPALYYVTGAALPTRYIFPTHLRERNERGAIGVDAIAEIRRILKHRPETIVLEQGRPSFTDPVLLPFLAHSYHQIASIKVGRRQQLVYVLKGT